MRVEAAYLRGLVLVAGASIVLSALVTCLVVKMALDLAGGVGIQSGDPMTLAIGGLGAASVLGISTRSLWRKRASMGWRAYGALIVALVIVGTVGGGIAGARISDEHVAYVRAAARDTCASFTAVHPDHAADCEGRAIDCRVEVRAQPPVIGRGLGGQPEQDREPTNPIERAVWACLAR